MILAGLSTFRPMPLRAIQQTNLLTIKLRPNPRNSGTDHATGGGGQLVFTVASG